MADLKYVFEVDDKDILTTIKNHEVLEKRLVSLKAESAKLDAATNKGKVSIQDYAKANEQLTKKIEQTEAALRKGGSAVNQLATGMNISGKSTRNMELQFQQAGYQIQDFIVQVQGGVNPLIAFSQQGSQLAGFFAGPWGAAIGLGIAAMSSLAMVMFSTAEETSKTVDVFKELAEATNQLYLERMKLVDSKFDENLQGTEEELKRLTEAYDKAKVAAQGLATYGGKVTGPQLFGIDTGEEAALAALEKAEADLKSYQIAKDLLLIAETQATVDEQNANRRIAYQDAYFQKLIEEAELRKEISDKIGEAYLSAIGLQQQPMDAGINKAAAAAQVLAEKLGISLNAARNIVALEAGKGFQAKDYSKQSYGGAMADRRLAGSSTPPVIKEAVVRMGGGGGGGAVAGRIDTQEEYLAKLVREYDMKKKSLGLTDEQIKRNEFLFTLDEKIATMKTKRTEMEIQTEKLRAISAYDSYLAAEKQAANMEMISSELNSAFLSMIDGSASVSDAFRSMMFNILKSVYEQTVTQPLANGITGLLKGFLGGGGGGTGSFGLPMPFAKGGVVGSPTTFAMSGGKTGLMGEAGPEAIMPLKRGSNGELGVQVNGNKNGGSGSITINNNINVVGSDAAMVRAEVTKMIPQITEASKRAVIDAKKRGGQMAAAFN